MKKPFPFFVLVAFLFLLINVSKPTADRVRTMALSSLGPVWNWTKTASGSPVEMNALCMENQRLRSQLEQAVQWILSEQRVAKEIGLIGASPQIPEQHVNYFRNALEMELATLPAAVIYRDPASWSSSLWINVGEKNNRDSGSSVVMRNSPVVAMGSLIGVVEYVGERQSRVRLITDSGLIPAVRVLRGGAQNREIAQWVEILDERLAMRDDLFPSSGEKEQLIATLHQLKKKLAPFKEEQFLAKGELYGSSTSFWRARSPLLKGIGFNYETSDEQGPARDLHSGSLIQKGDLLVTSGLDGVFPPGLKVAVVTEVGLLKEGGYAYEISARPTAISMNDLSSVLVMAPIAID